MPRLLIVIATAGLVVADFAAIQAPAIAQASPNVAEVIVYGTDPCPRSTDDQVVVCARRPEGDRYRIPEKLRPGGTRQQTEAWANKARVLETVGSTGTNTCSPVGPGGFTGCLAQVIREAREQRRETNDDYNPDRQ
jgi:hypothetical protein